MYSKCGTVLVPSHHCWSVRKTLQLSQAHLEVGKPSKKPHCLIKTGLKLTLLKGIWGLLMQVAKHSHLLSKVHLQPFSSTNTDISTKGRKREKRSILSKVTFFCCYCFVVVLFLFCFLLFWLFSKGTKCWSVPNFRGQTQWQWTTDYSWKQLLLSLMKATTLWIKL